MSLVILAVLFAYFMFVHRRVLNYFGLTERDNNLMWIGWLVPNFLIMAIQFALGIISGQFLVVPFALLVLVGFLIYNSYSKL